MTVFIEQFSDGHGCAPPNVPLDLPVKAQLERAAVEAADLANMLRRHLKLKNEKIYLSTYDTLDF